MPNPDKVVSLKPEVLATERPRFPFISYLKSLILFHTRGCTRPERISLRSDAWERFDREIRESGNLCRIENGDQLFQSLYVGQHEGGSYVVLHLPDYGEGE